jgi:hypothetical protein
MKEIRLTQGQVALVDDENYDWLNSFKWYAIKDKNNFYAGRAIVVNGTRTTQRMHQLIMGDNQLKLEIDHIDGNGCNNHQINLRFCTNQENMMNRRPNKNCSSIYKGVGWYERYGKWTARIRINGRLFNLGYFKIEEDAAKAYDVAAIKYFGEFAKINTYETA